MAQHTYGTYRSSWNPYTISSACHGGNGQCDGYTSDEDDQPGDECSCPCHMDGREPFASARTIPEMEQAHHDYWKA